MEFSHKPIMLAACLELLNIRPDGTYVDATLGGAGHAKEILGKLGAGGCLLGLDQDIEALEIARTRLEAVGSPAKVLTIQSNFENIREVLKEQKINTIDGALMDIGVSSWQLDEASRGFSYQHDARLDMRMDQRTELDAYTVINRWSESEIIRIIREYGEEKWAVRIASFIAKARQEAPIETTGQLVDIIKAAIPAAARRDGPHPAKRTFQAIRIAVNRELEVLETALDAFVSCLAPGGRLAVITFHSLEDRIVKKKFISLVNPCICPPDFPQCVCGNKPQVKLVNRKPIESDESELTENPRARSAKLRVVEKI